MGKVFLALDQKTGKEVAVKIVKDQKQWDRERVILQKLNIPKVCRNYFLQERKGTFSGDGIYSWKFVKTIWQCLVENFIKRKFIVDDQNLQSAE